MSINALLVVPTNNAPSISRGASPYRGNSKSMTFINLR